MVRCLVDYSDLPHTPISDTQYRSNLLRQIGDPMVLTNTPIRELEDMIDSGYVPTYIPLVDDEYRITFCQVTEGLPELCQVKIWDMVRKSHTVPNPPNAPHKGISPRLKGFMNRWAARKQLNF
jgi:hypothetical protein